MIGLSINAAKGLFFDRAAVTSAVDRADRQALSRFGAFVRRRARSSIRKRRAISEPGQPPSSHVGLVKQFLFFVYEPANKSVVIGPALLNKPEPDALALLEHGGTTVRRRRGKRVRMVYRPRPFMGPALRKELPRAPALWANSVR